jgi:hypothetical protein
MWSRIPYPSEVSGTGRLPFTIGSMKVKTIVSLLSSIIITLSVRGQGRILFYANLLPTPETTMPAIQVGDAWLNLIGNELSGNIRFSTRSQPISAHIMDSSGNIILQTVSFTFAYPDSASPGDTLDGVWSPVILSETQVQQLESGQWMAVVSTAQFPKGEIAGQFQFVPEPATWSLFTIGLLGILAFPRLRNYPITIGAGILSGDKK